MTEYKIRKYLLGVLFSLFIINVFCGQLVCAEDSAELFGKNLSYDIYIEGKESKLTVIKRVKIIEIKEIADKTFLVVENYGFKLKDAQGYVAFDAVKAILPNSEFKLEDTEDVKVRRH